MLNFEYISDDQMEKIMSFDCSDEISVEYFLKEHALKLHISNCAITRLYYDEDRNLIGYFTLYNDMVQIGREKRVKHGLEHLPPVKYLPAIKLHYLGVDSKYRGNDFGEYILLEAIYTAKKISKDTGCNFVTIESLNSAYDFYKKYDFQYLSKSNKDMTNMFFNLDEIE